MGILTLTVKNSLYNKFYPEGNKNSTKKGNVILFSISRSFRPLSDNSRSFRKISEDFQRYPRTSEVFQGISISHCCCVTMLLFSVFPLELRCNLNSFSLKPYKHLTGKTKIFQGQGKVREFFKNFDIVKVS